MRYMYYTSDRTGKNIYSNVFGVVVENDYFNVWFEPDPRHSNENMNATSSIVARLPKVYKMYASATFNSFLNTNDLFFLICFTSSVYALKVTNLLRLFDHGNAQTLQVDVDSSSSGKYIFYGADIHIITADPLMLFMSITLEFH
jgi:hypothetical protein